VYHNLNRLPGTTRKKDGKDIEVHFLAAFAPKSLG